MNPAQLKTEADGRVTITGPLSFATAGTLLKSSEDMFAGKNILEVDLGGVTLVDSAALALLIEWLRQARRHDCDLHFRAIPEKLLAIARLSGVEDIVGNTENGPAIA